MKTKSQTPMANGALWALVAALFFSINDMLIKFLSGGYALHQVVFTRSVVGVALIVIIILPFVGGLQKIKTQRLGLHILRSLCVVIANLFFYMALADMDLAQVVGIFFVAPFVVSIFSVIFLGEYVGPWRWVAIACGFAGVMIIVRPGTEAFRLVALLPLISAIGYASFHVFTRLLARTETSVSLTFYPPLVFVVVSAVIGLALGGGAYSDTNIASIAFLTRAWTMPALNDFAIMVFIGVGVTAGGYAISVAYRHAQAAVVAPMEYSALVYATAFGFVIFGEWPDQWDWLGMGIVLTSGLFMIWRDAVNARAAIAPPNAPR